MAAKLYFELIRFTSASVRDVEDHVHEWVAYGFRQVEFNGDKDDSFIRCKNVCAYIKNPTFSTVKSEEGNYVVLKGDLVPHGKRKEIAEEALSMPGHWRLVPVYWVDGTITKIVLEKKSLQEIGELDLVDAVKHIEKVMGNE